MGRQLKVYSGNALAPGAIATSVGNHHHVGQVNVYAVATSKLAAVDALKKLGVHVPAGRLDLAAGTSAAALNAAGLFDGPAVLVTHLNGNGPVARLADDRTPVVIGELVTAGRGTTVVGDRRIPETRTRFVPATPTT